tara:strand:- start:415 stop:1140 length:726 start_codon:yes stop_codon:yes gene_type:complete
MAYNQAPLKNIGDLRDKIVKRKLDKKFGVVEGADKFKQIEDFRSRATERNQPKVKTMETSFKTSIKPFEKETIKFDVTEKESTRRKQKSKLSKKAGEVGKKLGYGAVELGHIALDKLPMSGIIPGVGKRRNFVGVNLASGTQDRVIDSDEKGHHKRFTFGGIKTVHYPRMSNKEWRATKKRYTTGQKLENIGLKVGMKSLTGLVSAGMAMGFSGKQVDENTLNPVKEGAKRLFKKIKRVIN